MMKLSEGGRTAIARIEAPGADFWATWLRHRGYLYKRCLRWLGGNVQDAEDVLSKGAVNAAVYLRDNPQAVLQFRPWILRVLHNLCVDDLRARSRVAPEAAAPEAAAPASWTQCPAQGVLRGEIGRSIERAANGLPSHLHRVFMLRLVEEQPYEQIAREMDITPENARKRLQQARGLLKEALRALA